jgi:outer membrane protein assembly factor BamA
LYGNNILGTDEVVHLRGWNDWRMGDRLVFGTIEPRIRINKVVLASFIDYGNAWYTNGDAGCYNNNRWITTAGLEFRIDLFGFVLAYGTAQEIEGWRDNVVPTNYFRLSLVNPF